jgi:hypothetical protein
VENSKSNTIYLPITSFYDLSSSLYNNRPNARFIYNDSTGIAARPEYCDG